LFLSLRKFFQARDYFQRYCERAPDDLEAIYHLGFVNMILEELTEAENLFQKILNVNTQHVLAMHNMASIALKRREPSVALGYYQRILSVDPHDEIARYMEAALTQKNPPAHAPQKYVKALFDQYAANFDQHLKEVLHYQTPQHLYVLWKKCFADKSITILDLGCGTGLMGELFKPHAKKLVGVDISSEMIKIARKKKSYDELHEADILEFLENCQEKFDLIILADVLVYFGDLKPLFKSLQKTAGRLLFSIETTKKSPFELAATGRYQHSVESILALAKAHQFHVEKYETIVLRQQAHQEAMGAVFLFSYIY
jgi:predicted TPR repeat methyltransferase